MGKPMNITCTNCGFRAKEDLENVDVIKCKSCGEQIVVAIANALAANKKSGYKNVGAIKKEREKYIQYDIASKIKTYSEELLAINEYDYFSAYLLAYAECKLGNPKYILEFYETAILATTYELSQIVKHIIKFADVEYNKEIKKYLNKIPLKDIKIYKEVYEKAYEEKVNFKELNIINKDIYVSFNEADTDRVIELTKMLNDTSLTTLSSNIAFEDKSKLISKCDIFVSVASQGSMQSKNVIDELTFALQQNKPRIEIKLDKIERSALFNQAFANEKSVDMRSLNEKTFAQLTSIIFEKLKDLQNVVVNKRTIQEQQKPEEIELVEEEVINEIIEDIDLIEEQIHITQTVEVTEETIEDIEGNVKTETI